MLSKQLMGSRTVNKYENKFLLSQYQNNKAINNWILFLNNVALFLISAIIMKSKYYAHLVTFLQ